MSYYTESVPIPPVRPQAVQETGFVCSMVPSAIFCLLVSVCTVEHMGCCTITKPGNQILQCCWNVSFGQTDFLLLICGIWTGCLSHSVKKRRTKSCSTVKDGVHYLSDSIENSSIFLPIPSYLIIWKKYFVIQYIFEALRHLPCMAPFSMATDQAFVKQLQ